MKIALVIISALMGINFLDASESETAKRVVRKQIDRAHQYSSDEDEPELLHKVKPVADAEAKEHEEKSSASGVVSSKNERDKKHFLKLYQTMIFRFQDLSRYGGYDSMTKFPFTVLRGQLRSAIRRNAEVVKDPILATELVELCQYEGQTSVEDDPQPQRQPRSWVQKIGLMSESPSGTYKKEKYFKRLDKQLQIYILSIASLLVDNDADLSDITDGFPSQSHADECLSCCKLRNAWLDWQEAQQKVEKSS